MSEQATGKADRIDVYLVAGGKYHNIDYARLELLKLLAEQPRIKVQVGADYSDIDAICEVSRRRSPMLVAICVIAYDSHGEVHLFRVRS